MKEACLSSTQIWNHTSLANFSGRCQHDRKVIISGEFFLDNLGKQRLHLKHKNLLGTDISQTSALSSSIMSGFSRIVNLWTPDCVGTTRQNMNFSIEMYVPGMMEVRPKSIHNEPFWTLRQIERSSRNSFCPMALLNNNRLIEVSKKIPDYETIGISLAWRKRSNAAGWSRSIIWGLYGCSWNSWMS